MVSPPGTIVAAKRTNTAADYYVAGRKIGGFANGLAIAFVNLLIFFVIGVAAIALIKGNANYYDAQGTVIGGTNMVSVHLAHAVGGEVFFGVMAAIAFATILAVVAGLTLAAVSGWVYWGMTSPSFRKLMRRCLPSWQPLPACMSCQNLIIRRKWNSIESGSCRSINRRLVQIGMTH